MNTKRTDASQWAAMDESAALDRYLELTRIPGKSGDEAAVSSSIQAMLLQAGVDPAWIQSDDAGTKTRLSGNAGNLIVSLPGDESLPRTLLSAHMDTVPICVGSNPVVRDDEELGRIVVSDGPTGLGADDRSGCAVILSAIFERLARQAKQPDLRLAPAVILFLIQEEVGLEGARHLEVSKVGRVDRAFNFDGGGLDKIRHGAIGGERVQITVRGHAAHAGVAPEKGVSAIVIASEAISSLHRNGWLGLVEKDGRRGTANVGVFEGGDATNVITPEVQLRAEARSHDSEFRAEIVSQMKAAFEKAAQSVTDVQGRAGSVEFSSRVDYEAFRLAEDHPSVLAATQLISQLGRSPECEVANGGLDANWLMLHGIEAVTLGCGQASIHTVDEYLLVDEYLAACRLAAELIAPV
ncbi:M20/M25/M40 family metallo-hydrolase [Rhodopirellula sp. P2]|uniref:M20/M25/M40 family metallo-hydrolase n=1 Tax=Rhodopirellula sp. P2 TaxID=2127060 RepID=UPI002367D863|nr:M20/M25/M40 family metallo-hydrolase [Rhodopirellula sp. P2]WDQ18281.1 M20/M25/M40 family metallo-hydrolase [Rhodopirellula sp. P2]